jgi:very-short-patch-repair endonuclease
VEHLLDWSNLQKDYERLGTQAKVAELYGCKQQTVCKAMKRLGIDAVPVKGRTCSWTQEWRANHKMACNRPEVKAAHREALLRRFEESRVTGPSAGSPLEKLLHGALKRAGVSFTTQRRKLNRYVVDIELLQVPVVIEADGLKHQLERQKAKDVIRDAALTEAGYQVFRFTGTEINAGPDACIRRVIEATGVVPDLEPIADIRRGARGSDNHNWRPDSKVEHTCTQCGKVFVRYRSNRTYKKTFCSQKCYGSWMSEHSDENPVYVRWEHRTQQVVA